MFRYRFETLGLISLQVQVGNSRFSLYIQIQVRNSRFSPYIDPGGKLQVQFLFKQIQVGHSSFSFPFIQIQVGNSRFSFYGPGVKHQAQSLWFRLETLGSLSIYIDAGGKLYKFSFYIYRYRWETLQVQFLYIYRSRWETPQVQFLFKQIRVYRLKTYDGKINID